MPIPPATSSVYGACQPISKWLFGSPISSSSPVCRPHSQREPPRPGSARRTAMR